jgi:arylsulfatase A-like enzyme
MFAAMARPNILFITTDYQAWEDGPGLGAPFLDMPALDRLCREGVVCRNHYSNAPICVPARYSWITGAYPHTHGAFDNDPRWVPEGSPILMEELRRAGYRTTGVGKMHFHPLDRPAGFDRRIIADQKEAGWYEDDYARFLKANGFSVNRIFKKQSDDEIPRVYDFPEDERFHIDRYVGDQALGVIERQELGEPWFLWVSFNGPHSPWDPPAAYAAPYRAMDLPSPRWIENELDHKPHNHTASRYIYTRAVMDRIDENPARRGEIFHAMRAAHYGNLTLIDRQVERILDRLDANGVLDDTLVIWSADHGACLGDHDLIHKDTHYERSCHVPFVARWPGTIRPRSIEALTGHVDLMPTLLAVAGAPVPDAVEGKDLLPLLREDVESVQDEVFLEIRNDTSIITRDWKLGVTAGPRFPSRYGILAGDLYDRKKDPDELANLYDDPRCREIQAELLERLFAFNPKLRECVRSPAPAPPEPPARLEFTHGEVCGLKTKREIPHLQGKALRVTADVAPPAGEALSGMIFDWATGPHGYRMAAEDGRISFTVVRFGKATRVEGPLPEGHLAIEATLSADGTATIAAGGAVLASGPTSGPVPATPGRKIRETAGELRVGHAPPRADAPGLNGRVTRLVIECGRVRGS